MFPVTPGRVHLTDLLLGGAPGSSPRFYGLWHVNHGVALLALLVLVIGVVVALVRRR